MDRSGSTSSHVDVGDVLARAMGLPPPPRPGRPTRAERSLRQAIRQAIRDAAERPFEIRVPGTHAGGISNQDLFAVLASQGRDFLDANSAMVAHCIRVLDDAFLDGGLVPSERSLRDVLSDAAVDWARGRMDGSRRDVRIRALTYQYAKAKAKAGYGDNPIGVRTGQLFAALERARVVFV